MEKTAYKLITGAVGDLPMKGLRAINAYRLTGDLSRSIEEVSPRSIKNLQAAYRWANEGKATNIMGETVMENPSALEIAQKAASFTPTRFAEAQRREQEIRKLAADETEKSKGLNRKLAIAIDLGDTETEDELRDYARQNGITVKESTIRRIIEKNNNPEQRLLGKIPKGGKGGKDKAEQIINKYKN